MILEIFIYSFVLLISVFGIKYIGVIREKKLCPCMVKVPFTILTLGVMAFSYYFLNSNIDFLIWGPTIGFILIGNFLVGKIKEKIWWTETLGTISFVIGYIYAIILLIITFGIPYIMILILSSSFALFFIYSIIYFFNPKFSVAWKEYIYTILLFTLLCFTSQIGVGQVIIPAMAAYIISELGLQFIRFNSLDNKDDMEYDLTLIYIISMAMFAIPKIVF